MWFLDQINREIQFVDKNEEGCCESRVREENT